MICCWEKPRRSLSSALMESAWHESVEKTKFFSATIRSSTWRHVAPKVGGVEMCVAFLDVKALGWIRQFLRAVLHQIMKHCSLVSLIGETISCAKAVREYCISSSRSMGSSRCWDLMSNMKSEVTLRTVLDNLQKIKRATFYTCCKLKYHKTVIYCSYSRNLGSHTFPCKAVSLNVLLESCMVFSFCLVIGSKNSVSEQPFMNRSRIKSSLAS